jgi:protein SCO1/2
MCSPVDKRSLRIVLLSAALLLLRPLPGVAEELVAHLAPIHVAAAAAVGDPHAHHRHMMVMQKKDFQRSEHDYQPPDLPLVSMDGSHTSLLAELERDEPIMLNFIFSTCTTICPVLSASFSSVQQQLGEDRDRVRMLSITIDPEHDTPEQLRAYAERFHAGPQWQFLTGNIDDIVAVQKAFGAYWGNKTNHEPATFLRGSKQGPWVRLDGIASAAIILEEFNRLNGK